MSKDTTNATNLPPQNVEAEQAVLGGVLLDPSALVRVAAMLRAEHFYCKGHREIYKAALGIHERGEPVDLVTVTDELRKAGTLEEAGDVSALSALLDAATGTSNVEHHARLIVDTATKRKTVEVLNGALANAYAMDCNTDTLLIQSRNALTDLSLEHMAAQRHELRPDAAVLDEYLEDLAERQGDKDVYGLKTGHEHMDELLNGLQMGLLVLGGAPGCGKTTFVKQVADDVARLNGCPVLFLAYDENAEAQRLKTLARLSDVPMRQIKKGRVDVDAWDKVKRAAEEYKTFGHLVYVISGNITEKMTPQRIQLEAESLKHKTNADRILVIVDYLQIVPVEAPRDFDSDKTRVDYICKRLCHVAEETNATILAISQLNRQGYKSVLEIGNFEIFKETGGIEYNAFQAMALGYDTDETKKLSNRDDEERIVQLVLHKNRDGGLGRCRFTYFPKVAKFEEDPDDTAHETIKGGVPF